MCLLYCKFKLRPNNTMTSFVAMPKVIRLSYFIMEPKQDRKYPIRIGAC
jgi:hypothetical protein